jgi:Spy/CpxP family protein refolding chaperone
MRNILVSLTLAAAAAGASAQHTGHHVPVSGYAGMQEREIKALSAEQMADLRQGRGMGASLPAELNGVPGPMHVLELAPQLKLTPEQRASLEGITAEMKTSAQQLGRQVIAAEAELDAAFKSNAADEKTIADTTARIASLQGQLRAVHLVAHLRTRRLLSVDQITAYNVARGYVADAGAHKHRH